MKLTTTSLILATSLAITGCNSTPTKTSSTPPPQSQTSATAEYRIGSGDVIDIRVWRNPDLSVVATVRPDGKISVPLAGDIHAEGESVESLKVLISDGLKNYLKAPTVTVIVTEANSIEFTQRVRITGAVAQPLSTPWRKGMTVLDLVLLAGGSTEFAAENKAYLYRKSNDQMQAYPIYLESILKQGNLETNYTLSPSDIISVPERLF